MKPRVYTVTVCKNEDVWIGPTLGAWARFAEKMLVLDTGSIDSTRGVIEKEAKRSIRKRKATREELDIYGLESANIMDTTFEMYAETLDVGSSMVARQELIDRVPKEEGVWVIILDADEVYHEDSIRALLAEMENPETDYIGTRPVPVGWDGKTCFYISPLQPFDDADVAQYTTKYWCPKVTIHAMRRTRLDGVSDPRWGSEVFHVKLDPERHKITDDSKWLPVPEGHIPIQFSGRTAWTDIAYAHMSYVTRSSKWREIEQTPGSNATDRLRSRMYGPAKHPLPPTFKVPDSVTRTLATLERPW